MTTTVHDDKGTERRVTVAQDEGIRPNTTMEGLAKLKPAFKEGGSTTAGETGLGTSMLDVLWEPEPPDRVGVGGLGLLRPALGSPYPCGLLLGNSSQVSDGAAAILLARRSKAEELGLPILGILRSYAVVGVPPDIMGIGPAYAIPVALKKAGRRLLRALGLDPTSAPHADAGGRWSWGCCRVKVGQTSTPARALPDHTAGTHSFIWNRHRHTRQPKARDGVGPHETESPVRVRGHWVSSGLSPLPAGLTVHDVDIFEINEAFASQVSLCFSTLPGPSAAQLEPGVPGRAGVIADGLPPHRPSTAWRS